MKQMQLAVTGIVSYSIAGHGVDCKTCIRGILCSVYSTWSENADVIYVKSQQLNPIWVWLMVIIRTDLLWLFQKVYSLQAQVAV